MGPSPLTREFGRASYTSRGPGSRPSRAEEKDCAAGACPFDMSLTAHEQATRRTPHPHHPGRSARHPLEALFAKERAEGRLPDLSKQELWESMARDFLDL